MRRTAFSFFPFDNHPRVSSTTVRWLLVFECACGDQICGLEPSVSYYGNGKLTYNKSSGAFLLKDHLFIFWQLVEDILNQLKF